MNERVIIGAIGVFAVAAAFGAPGKAEFVDYYASASSLIAVLNGVASDVDRLDLRGGNFADEEAKELKLRVAKTREGFANLLTYDKHTTEINEGYILYLDKVLLALMLAGENKRGGDAETRKRVDALLAEAASLRAHLNATVAKDKKKWGVD